MKVEFLDKNVRNIFWKYFSVISGVISFVLLFKIVPEDFKDYLDYFGYLLFFVLVVVYLFIWRRANKLTNVDINIEGSTVTIKCGDIFSEDGFKAIAFNEYFDTIVDDKIISSKSLNGIFINRFFENKVTDLDNFIISNSEVEDIIDPQSSRRLGGKTTKYKLSTIIV